MSSEIHSLKKKKEIQPLRLISHICGSLLCVDKQLFKEYSFVNVI